MPFSHDGYVTRLRRLNPLSYPWQQANRLKARLYQRKLVARGWYDSAARCEAEAIFIGGCGRSGTTLFREMLNRHPRIACGPETSMFGLPFNVSNIAPYWELNEEELREQAERSENLIAFAAWFYKSFLGREGKARWADKTPNNVRVIGRILTWFPRGKFIHLIRDGRDVVCSLRHHPREKVINGVLTPVQTNNPVEKCATRWLNDTAAGLAFQRHARCLGVRYEDLVAEPEHELRRVCDFVGEDYDPGMLGSAALTELDMPAGRLVNNPNATGEVSAKSIGRWRHDLSVDEGQHFVDIAGELLVALGYVRDHSWVDESFQA